MNISILGADGFIGSHLVDACLAQGHTVRALCRLRDGRSRNLEHVRDRISLIDGDVLAGGQLEEAIEGAEVVYHLVYCSTPVESWEKPEVELDLNVRVSLRVFDACVRQQVSRVVFTSSGGAVYGPMKDEITEDCLPAPVSPYGISKLCIEHYLRYYRARFGLSHDIYRIGNAYGPRQDPTRPQGVIAKWLAKVLAGETIEVYGDEKTCRDYVHVQDVAELMTHSLRKRDDDQTFNLGTGVGTSILQLLDYLKAAVDVPVDCRILPKRDLDNQSVILNSQKLLSHFDAFRLRSLPESLSELWANVSS